MQAKLHSIFFFAAVIYGLDCSGSTFKVAVAGTVVRRFFSLP
jgi:hypothetical protein